MEVQHSSKRIEKKQNQFMRIVVKGSPFIILILLFGGLCIFNENFRTFSNFMNIIKQTAPIGIIAVGQALVIIAGGIDLSVGSIMAMSGCVMAVASTEWGMGGFISVILGLLAGTLIGVINGILVTKAHLQDFIATLGTLTAFQGFALMVTRGYPISGMPAGMLYFGNGHMGQFPFAGIVFIVVCFAGWVILRHTTLGRNIYAIGGNREASRVSGIKIDRVKITVSTITGFFCSIAGLVMIGRINSANGTMGNGFELTAITAVALGGTSLSGGTGTMLGTIIGILTMGVLSTGLDLMAVEPYVQKVVMGIVIVGVVTLDTWRGRKTRAVE